MIKRFAICKQTGNIVYRIPGYKWGDGQIDSNEKPVWIRTDESDLPDDLIYELLDELDTESPDRVSGYMTYGA